MTDKMIIISYFIAALARKLKLYYYNSPKYHKSHTPMREVSCDHKSHECLTFDACDISCIPMETLVHTVFDSDHPVVGNLYKF